jgi:hypothetical protein
VSSPSRPTTGSTAAYMNALPQMQLGTDPGGNAYM